MRTRRAACNRARLGRAARLVLAVGAVLASLASPASAVDKGLVGSQGTDFTDPPLPQDPASVVQVRGRPPFANLKITINQTKHLTDQAISVTWEGGSPTTDSRSFNTNFLQIFQCWGDDDGTVPADPGPPAQQCEFGDSQKEKSGLQGQYGAANRVVSVSDWANYKDVQGRSDLYVPPGQSAVYMPFRAVNGDVVNVLDVGDGPKVNRYFDFNTSNEIPFARTFGDGRGSELFNLDSGARAPGLGCGQTIDRTNGPAFVPRCWLVIVPRGEPAQENSAEGAHADKLSVTTSPLTPSVWANRIAVPLDFTPLGSRCPSGAAPRIVVGTEMAALAATNWNPTLCAQANAAPFDYVANGDLVARSQLRSGLAGMIVTQRPLNPATFDPEAPVVYAPLTVSGTTLGFNLERQVDGTGRQPVDVQNAVLPLQGTRVARINLTPRLVAKLLTQSYRELYTAVTGIPGGPGNLFTTKPPSGYEWVKDNPEDLAADKDFLQYNPEFALLGVANRRTLAAPLVEGARQSDATAQLWAWVLADPEARAWLAGGGDNNTPPMRVNPYSSTDPRVNPAGTFGDSAPTVYPKNDPYCFQSSVLTGSPPQSVPKLCLTDVNPYALDLPSAASMTRSARDGARDVTDGADPGVPPGRYWIPDAPQIPGRRSMVAVTDTASATRFGLQMARLSRAGDDGPSRAFIAPDDAGLKAAVQAMAPDPQVPQVRSADPAKAPGAYPLTVLTYAALQPARLDPAARADFARFLSYAAGDGQVRGFDFGHLLPGYAPLPADLQAQTRAGAATVLAGGARSPAASNGGNTPSGPRASREAGPAGVSSGGTSGSPGGGNAATAPASGGQVNAPPPTVVLHKGSSTAPKAVSRTLAMAVGVMRYTAPVAAALGLLATAAAWLLERRRRAGLVPAVSAPPPTAARWSMPPPPRLPDLPAVIPDPNAAAPGGGPWPSMPERPQPKNRRR